MLAAHHHQLPTRGVIDFGDGILAIPRARRPRRGPEPTARPFDAGEIRLRDGDRPTDNRHTVSLISELAEHLRTPPELADDREERAYLIRASIDELEKRGFDRSDLLAGAARIVATTMVSAIAALLFLEASEQESEKGKLNPAWDKIRHAWAPQEEGQAPWGTLDRILAPELVLKLVAWNLSRTAEQLIEWQAPPIDFLNVPLRSASLSSTERGTWLFDRFTKTYFAEWSIYSLDLEWEYLHSATPGCGDASQMSLRRIDVNALAKELADRSVQRRKGEKEEDSRSIDPTDFIPIAVDHLRAGRYEAAVALFEGVHKLRPTDPVVLNNLGFCLIPVDPDRAITALEESARLAPNPRALTYANLAFVYLRHGDIAEAQESVARCLALPAEQNVWLWKINKSGALEINNGNQTSQYVRTLLGEIAESD
ncbi:tetratricopeptide repeat protein [Planosporangium sp. 12N6]|uniref:tetratricopeptide repeat protein n=1 Tax=Planosporangium spinosum TaxID=3402278 RepID=UPI003CF30FB4